MNVFSLQKIKSRQQGPLVASQLLVPLMAKQPVELLVARHLEVEPSQLEVPVENQHHQHQVQSQQHLRLLPQVVSRAELLAGSQPHLQEERELLVASLHQQLEARVLQERPLEARLQPQEGNLQLLLEAKLEQQEARLLVPKEHQLQGKLGASKEQQLQVGRQLVVPLGLPKREQRVPSLLLEPSREQQPNQQLEQRDQQDQQPRDLLPRNRPVGQQLPRKELRRNQELREQLARLVPRA